MKSTQKHPRKKSMKKPIITALILVLVLPILMAAAFLLYASDYYRADDIATAILQEGSGLQVQDNLILLMPDSPSDTALIFYPGAKVEYTAYLPILEKLRQGGIACALVKMPFNMAIFDQNAADKVFEELPDIRQWYVGGHSMGGAMASSYAATHKEQVKGLILLGAYIYGDVSPNDALTIYGTLNASLEKNINYTENVVILPGGNHAQFGNYGAQRKDPPATMSQEEQQNLAVQAILDFIEDKSVEE